MVSKGFNLALASAAIARAVSGVRKLLLIRESMRAAATALPVVRRETCSKQL
jgi:hypothetical protein